MKHQHVFIATAPYPKAGVLVRDIACACGRIAGTEVPYRPVQARLMAERKETK
jgi:hypothetical protein